MSESTLYTYVFVRTDIPLADQIVQVGHACLAAGRCFPQPPQPCHLVVLGVPSQLHLHDMIERSQLMGIRCTVFHEPDDALGDTAACTEPLQQGQRRAFRRFALWGRAPPSPT